VACCAAQPGYLRLQLPTAAPEHPEPFASVMADFKNLLLPGVLHWQSPKFFAYFNANSRCDVAAQSLFAEQHRV
jgi:hypothetical protein